MPTSTATFAKIATTGLDPFASLRAAGTQTTGAGPDGAGTDFASLVSREAAAGPRPTGQRPYGQFSLRAPTSRAEVSRDLGPVTFALDDGAIPARPEAGTEDAAPGDAAQFPATAEDKALETGSATGERAAALPEAAPAPPPPAPPPAATTDLIDAQTRAPVAAPDEAEQAATADAVSAENGAAVPPQPVPLAVAPVTPGAFAAYALASAAAPRPQIAADGALVGRTAARAAQPQPEKSDPGAAQGPQAAARTFTLSTVEATAAPAAFDVGSLSFYADPDAGRFAAQSGATEDFAQIAAPASGEASPVRALQALAALALESQTQPGDLGAAFAVAQTPAPGAASAAPVSSASAQPVPLPTQVAEQIIRRFDGGTTQFEIRLDPAELGKIDVRIEISGDNTASAVIAAENPATLSDLVRSARELERALQSAGLNLAENGLSFDLSRRHQRDDDAPRGAQGEARSGGDAPHQPDRPLALESWRSSRIDIRA